MFMSMSGVGWVVVESSRVKGWMDVDVDFGCCSTRSLDLLLPTAPTPKNQPITCMI